MLGEGEGAKLGGEGAKLGDGCPKVRLSQDRLPISPSPSLFSFNWCATTSLSLVSQLCKKELEGEKGR